MIKFVKIDAVLNHIANVVKDDEDTLQLISWANDQYRNYELPIRYDLQYALIDVINHKAKLPDDVHRIIDILYSPSYPDTNIQTVLKDFGDYRLIIAQEIFFGSPYWATFRPIKYKGQNRAALIDEDIYCKDKNCEIGFSVDASLSCLTIDLIDGEIMIEYFTTVKDENNNILIPNDTDLLKGLAAYAESQYWKNKAYAHEERAYQFYMDNLSISNTLLNKFRGKMLLRNINVKDQNEFVFKRNKPNYTNNNRQKYTYR